MLCPPAVEDSSAGSPVVPVQPPSKADSAHQSSSCLALELRTTSQYLRPRCSYAAARVHQANRVERYSSPPYLSAPLSAIPMAVVKRHTRPPSACSGHQHRTWPFCGSRCPHRRMYPTPCFVFSRAPAHSSCPPQQLPTVSPSGWVPSAHWAYPVFASRRGVVGGQSGVDSWAHQTLRS